MGRGSRWEVHGEDHIVTLLQKICPIFHLEIDEILSNANKRAEDGPNFCGLLIISELYTWTPSCRRFRFIPVVSNEKYMTRSLESRKECE